MKFLVRFISIVFCTAFFFSTAACAEKELENDYQYISLFEGYFPIPVNFVLISWSETALEYSSFDPKIGEDGSKLWSEIPEIGQIRIGMRQDISTEVGDLDTKPIGQCGLLVINEIFLTLDQGATDSEMPRIVMIIGEKNFVTITGFEEDFWQELLRQYAKVSDIPREDCDF